ncbi:MAG: molecular chaperone HtpG [Acidobacteriaceae bacterium]|jgi:molecular chaperone HtpG|nr:molecular chaperone HtpG [Acidobacteriaceae bacterium]
MTSTSSKETRGFQAEVTQLLHLMIHSLYGNKEIFLRELISNASDACDKLRFESVSRGALSAGDPEFRIRVSYDKTARTITVSDNGIGMSRQDAIDHLGTIAKSGTREFFERLTTDAAKDAQLIGQFGVGFYSAFIVADRVTVVSRRADLAPEEGIRWESSGEGEYTLETLTKDTRGTDVVLHLRADEDELLSGTRLREIVHKYSDHITFPILMAKEQWDAQAQTWQAASEDEQVNKASALWARSKLEIADAEYQQFYENMAHDVEPPLAWTHAKVEGRQEFTQLFYLPRRASFDIWDRDERHGVKLYVRRVFIMDAAKQLLPAYLRFVRGVVDSADLPLNVSREILQQSSDVAQIRTASVKRVLGLLEDLAKDQPEKYQAFWNEFGRVLKEGILEDHGNRERLAKLLRFSSTRTDVPEQTVSLQEYVGRMKEGQEAIYFVTADTFSAAKNSPHLEVFRKHGVEVLLLADRVDEWVVTHLAMFDGKSLQSAAQGNLDVTKLGEASTVVADAAQEEQYADLLTRIQAALHDRASAVRLTHRLTDSPACLVADEHGMSRHLERILRESGQAPPAQKPILEINPEHPVVARLKAEQDAALFADWSHILFDQALLAEGGELEDPAMFVKRLNSLTLALSGVAASRLWTPPS